MPATALRAKWSNGYATTTRICSMSRRRSRRAIFLGCGRSRHDIGLDFDALIAKHGDDKLRRLIARVRRGPTVRQRFPLPCLEISRLR